MHRQASQKDDKNDRRKSLYSSPTKLQVEPNELFHRTYSYRIHRNRGFDGELEITNLISDVGNKNEESEPDSAIYVIVIVNNLLVFVFWDGRRCEQKSSKMLYGCPVHFCHIRAFAVNRNFDIAD